MIISGTIESWNELIAVTLMDDGCSTPHAESLARQIINKAKVRAHQERFTEAGDELPMEGLMKSDAGAHLADIAGKTIEQKALATNDSNIKQLDVVLRALAIHDDRNVRYKDNWRRFGWRGCLFRLRERTERAWDALWEAPLPPADDEKFEGQDAVIDDLLDLINFAAYTIRAIEEGNRDGTWFK
jgi:hypothetical protein